MQLITEGYQEENAMLVESTKEGGALYLEGPFLMAEGINRNLRKYPRQLMESFVETYHKDFIGESRALGELNHPSYPLPDPSKAVLITQSLSWQGNNVNGKARVVEGAAGMQLKALIEAGFRVGVSSRGLGTIRKGREYSVVEKYILNAIDAVDKPSGQVCYVNAINESNVEEWVEENGIWVQRKRFDEATFLNKLDLMLETLKDQRKGKNVKV